MWIATAGAEPDTGKLPLPDEIDLGALPELPSPAESIPQADDGLWSFQLTDTPGSWFDSGVNLAGRVLVDVAEPLERAA